MARKEDAYGPWPLSPDGVGRVASLHIHPAKPGLSLIAVQSFHLVAQKGIEEDVRYFGRTNRFNGQPSRRQLSVIEREQILSHAKSFGIDNFAPGLVRSNIETTGILLRDWLGCEVQIGQAVVLFYEPRTPCPKMDAIQPGLQERMKEARQGVMAQIIRSGQVKIGDFLQKL